MLDIALAVALIAARPAEIKAIDKQLYCMAENLYHEARGESHLGQLAVANVVLNRVDHKSYPNSICGVTRQSKWVIRNGKKIRPRKNRCQFSWYCDDIPDKIRNLKSWNTSYKVAVGAIYGTVEDPTTGSTHYHADYVNPYWVKAMTKQTKIGKHIFYRRTRDVLRDK